MKTARPVLRVGSELCAHPAYMDEKQLRSIENAYALIIVIPTEAEHVNYSNGHSYSAECKASYVISAKWSEWRNLLFRILD